MEEQAPISTYLSASVSLFQKLTQEKKQKKKRKVSVGSERRVSFLCLCLCLWVGGWVRVGVGVYVGPNLNDKDMGDLHICHICFHFSPSLRSPYVSGQGKI